MEHSSAPDPPAIRTIDLQPAAHSFADDVDLGLAGSPKSLPCMYLYDYQGSQIFERICELPEYYLTPTEAGILEDFSGEIVSCLPENPLLVELGCGSCTKTRHIIEELLSRHERVTYYPIDVSKDMLRESAVTLLESYEGLEIISVAARYRDGLRQIAARTDRARVILWLGSSIGNYTFAEATRFLSGVARTLSRADALLVGFDLEKDKTTLLKAYNDAEGMTARFNLNLLARINRELGGQFDLDRFTHLAVYNEVQSRIEMYLESVCEQDIVITALGKRFHFDRHERIHTENSHKFSQERIQTLADRSGLRIANQWSDSAGYFGLTLLRPNGR